MAFSDDLLEQAQHLARREKHKPKQASLRRAVSTAYYALFHLLIAETVVNWRRVDQRSTLARAFDHSAMRRASEKTMKSPFTGQDLKYVAVLQSVADTFVQLQHDRHTADYDNTTTWSRTEVLARINQVKNAVHAWHVIRTTKIAQDYLLSLLIKPRQ